MRAQRSEQIVERARGVSDGVENGQWIFDAETLAGDAVECGDDVMVLLGEHSPQIQ